MPETCLPHLVQEEDIVFLEELNVEVINPPQRVDKAYKVLYRGIPHVLHIEFESGSNRRMDTRVLIYHAYFLDKYEMLVISLIVYPFETTMVISPLREMSGQKELLKFDYRTLPLWRLNAKKYVSERIVSMYALLPTMDGITLEMLRDAIEEMIEYHKGDDIKLTRQLLCFGVLLRRAKRLSQEDLNKVEEQLRMHNQLLDEDPYLQERDALAEARGEARGEVKALQGTIVTFVQMKYPSLADLAQQKVAQLDQPNILTFLLEQIFTAPDEHFVRQLLRPLVA